MKITTLAQTPIEKIVACLTASFQDYFVKIPDDVSYWKNRFEHARVDKNLSWGVFDQEELVGFVINGIDQINGHLTAYNTGTGVLKKYRGQRLVDQMYAFGIPQLLSNGITNCSLEVIDQNAIGIRVYERIGFKIQKRLKCYKGDLEVNEPVLIGEASIDQIADYINDDLYSWDNKLATVRKAGELYISYKVLDSESKTVVGHFIMNPKNGYIAQLETYDGNWNQVFAGIHQISDTIKINNVHESRTELIGYLNQVGIPNVIDQFEMEMKI